MSYNDNVRRDHLNKLRQMQTNANRSTHMKHDWDDDEGFAELGKTFWKIGLVALLVNLVFWAAIIAMVVFGLSLIL